MDGGRCLWTTLMYIVFGGKPTFIVVLFGGKPTFIVVHFFCGNFYSRFQELDLSKNAYIFNDSAKEDEWYQRVRRALHPKARYVRVSKLFRNGTTKTLWDVCRPDIIWLYVSIVPTPTGKKLKMGEQFQVRKF